MPDETTLVMRDRLSMIAAYLNDSIFPVIEEDLPAEVRRWKGRVDELSREIQQRDETRIAMVGSTGAGKSTLLNAILGREILPVSSMKPCTAVITTVHHSEGSTYRAQVGFLTLDEWLSELRASGDILDSDVDEEEQSDNGTWEDLKRVTRDKLRAVYGLTDVESDSRIDISSIPLPDDVARLLNPESGPVLVQNDDPRVFAKELKRYLSGDERYWPLVKSVEVEGPFPALANSAVLIDLPGVNDPNAAREEVTRRYLRDAEFVWVIFNTKRGVTADVRNLLLEQKLLRQLLLDGKANALTLVGTHADDVSGVTPEHLGFAEDEDVEPLAIIAERNRQVVAQMRSDLDEIAEELARLAGETGAGLSKLRRTLQGAAIVPVLTRAYMKLRKIGRVLVDFGVTDEQATGIPELLAHLDGICHERSPQAHAIKVSNKADILLEEIEQSLRARRAHIEAVEEGRGADAARFRGRLDGLCDELYRSLDTAHAKAGAGFEARRETFEERLRSAVADARSRVSDRVGNWANMHWATIRAVAARDGVFVNSKGQRYDFNADIAEPLLRAIPFAWDDFFGTHLALALTELRGQLEMFSRVFAARIQGEAQLGGLTDIEVLATIERDADVSARTLEFRVEETIKGLRSTIERVRRDLWASITLTVTEMMRPAYEAARAEKGTGLKSRMLAVMRDRAQVSAAKTFETIELDLHDGISELGVQLDARLRELEGHVREQASRIVSNVSGGFESPAGGSAQGALARIDTGIESVAHLRGNAARAV